MGKYVPDAVKKGARRSVGDLSGSIADIPQREPQLWVYSIF